MFTYLSQFLLGIKRALYYYIYTIVSNRSFLAHARLVQHWCRASMWREQVPKMPSVLCTIKKPSKAPSTREKRRFVESKRHWASWWSNAANSGIGESRQEKLKPALISFKLS
jgi:hypothetical protein